MPSGRVMMAGWNSTTIEIFDPPYMFQPRPKILSAPSLVHHGANFTISAPNAGSIVKTVLVRPMAVTHQTESTTRGFRPRDGGFTCTEGEAHIPGNPPSQPPPECKSEASAYAVAQREPTRGATPAPEQGRRR